jgi:hypothetical protein
MFVRILTERVYIYAYANVHSCPLEPTSKAPSATK